MSILVRFAPAGAATTQQYDETVSRLQSDGGEFPPDGAAGIEPATSRV